ncbi:MAG TPA: 16S rRNA (cytosine(967)-C(5))-methyltransferase RsmB [Firmicutes bacterium]|nr:16S rRNA (cytosine(967)-C(5))-methyltransferase RsmB [Candidatus Fermentithermobacillaceae bacterium]
MGLAARKVALDILCIGEKRAFRASPFQGKSFRALPPDDRALCEELVMGTWRWRNVLDSVIASWSRYPVERLETRVREALRLGVYEILFTRMPAPAAVSITVDAVGKASRQKALVNAVLRRVAEHSGHIEMPPIEDLESYIETRFSHPRWIVRRFIDTFGERGALALASFDQRVPPVTLRTNVLKTTRDSLVDLLRKAGVQARPGRYLDMAVEVSRAGPVTDLPGYHDGLFSIQDEGAMAVSLVVDPQPGEVVWDACAAPGGKTTHLAELMGDRGLVVATDKHEEGLGLLRHSVTRLGLRNIQIVYMDVTDLGSVAGKFEGPFDRVLVDAPCTGLGVLRRRADLRWRRREKDVSAMTDIQKKILNAVAPLVKPGGVLVYSTCTLTEEENQGVFSEFLEDHPEFSPSDPRPFLPASMFKDEVPPEPRYRLSTGPGTVLLLPHVHGTDGFFIARAVRCH